MLSKKTKYGLKALTYLARHQNDEGLVSIGDIAKCEKISRKFLESILLSLKKAGFLNAKKGKGGGYYLIKEASEIKMVDVFRVLEGPIAMLPCVSLNYYEECQDCPDEKSCGLHKLMIEVRDNTLKIFRNHTLQDLV
ncbi:MAG: Rrf2 family transcriptional regulator [Flavobacteriaceae bacterium]|nr:Rrf2 family transcriptional regulator [Flavobacteriaceae bacterium]